MNYALLMSGGVDSALACHFMVEAGLRPDLFYIKIGMQGEDTTCTAEEDLELCQLTARRYALQLDTVDLQQAYHDSVTAYLVDRVRRGLTPNPDVMCNRLIKFGAFHQAAGHAYDRIATGHYAQVLREPQPFALPYGVKPMAAVIAQPLAGVGIDDVAALLAQECAQVVGVMDAPEETESLAVAAVGCGQLQEVGLSAHLGFVQVANGKEHFAHLPVVGLRKEVALVLHGIGRGGEPQLAVGLGGGPWFVTHKDVATNTLYVSRTADAHGVYRRQFRLTAFHFVTTDPWHGAAECPVLCKIRHTEPPCPCHMQRLPGGDLLITSTTPLQGVAPGQFGVLYTADLRICAGSGEIRV